MNVGDKVVTPYGTGFVTLSPVLLDPQTHIAVTLDGQGRSIVRVEECVVVS